MSYNLRPFLLARNAYVISAPIASFILRLFGTEGGGVGCPSLLRNTYTRGYLLLEDFLEDAAE
jgi:hypothetical protein